MSATDAAASGMRAAPAPASAHRPGAPFRAGLAAWLSHWRRHPWQAVALVAGLAIATGLWTGVQAINAEARAAYDRAAAIVGQSDLDRLVARDGGPVAVSDYVALRRAGWLVAPVLEGRLRVAGRTVTLTGLDPLTMPVLPSANSADGGTGGNGLAAFVGPPGQLYAAPRTAQAVADALEPEILSSPDMAPGQLMGDVATVARLLDRPDTLSHLAVLAPPPEGVRLADLAPGLKRESPPQSAGIGGLADSFHLNLTAFGFLSFAVGLFIVHGAVGLAFEQRRGTVRTLRALGLPARTLTAIAGLEMATLALVAGGLGVALGYIVASLLLPGVSATLSGLYGAPAAGDLALRPGWVASGLAMAAAGTALAAARNLVQLHRMPILEGARPAAWAGAAARGAPRQTAVGLAALAAATALAVAGDGLIAGFAMIGCGLGGAALLLPPVLSWTLRMAAARAQGPVAQWVWADARQQVPALSLALMALMLALAANVGVSTMVGSFRATFTDYLDARVAADLYVSAADEAEADRLGAWLTPRTEAALPRRSTEAQVAGRPGQVEALQAHPFYRDTWPLRAAVPDAWARLAEGGAVFVNEQAANGAGLALGDRVDVAGEPFTLAGIYADYGNTRFAAVLGAAAFADRFPSVPRTRFEVVARGDPEALRQALAEDFGLPDSRILDSARIRESALAVFERTFIVTGALNVLTLGVAALALFFSLATLAGQRLPQVAPLWALGLTRARIARLDLARTAALAALTALVALPVGLALAWALLAVVQVEAFGWRLPMHVFPADYARLAGLAVLAALVAAALPALRLARQPPAALLKVFAHDR